MTRAIAACVEIAALGGQERGAWDSKNPGGPHLRSAVYELRASLSAIKNNHYEL